MKKVLGFSFGIVIALVALLSVAIAPETFAQSAIQAGAEAARGSGVPSTLFGDTGIITTITNTLLFIVGVLAVIMIIFGGIRYATSAGNSSAVTAAKNTILYAIVGLIIAFLAFAAVNWVLGAVTPGAGGGAGFTNV
jgi:preprotein translocase subunit SecG